MRLALLLFLAALPSHAAENVIRQAAESNTKPELHWQSLDPYIAEFKKLKATAQARHKELELLSNQYALSREIDAVSLQRDQLRGTLSQLAGEIDTIEEDFKGLLKSVEMVAITAGFSMALNKKGFEGTDRDLHSALYYDEAKNEMRAMKKGIRHSLNADEIKWIAALEQRAEKKRIWVLAGAAAGAIVLTALVTFGLGRRKPDFATQPITAHLTGTPPTGFLSGAATPALGGPVSGPAGAPVSASPGGPISGPVGAPITSGSATNVVPGTVLNDNFEITKELGKGGMGIVYEAKDITLARSVAIKRMREEIVSSKKELDMFLSEARMVASLKHLNLVEIYSIFRDQNQLYLVFELVTGKSLYELMEEGEPLAHETVKNIIRQSAEGLDYAHSQKVIHRDLKPSNVMITGDAIVKIMDFGLAHQAKKTVAKLTKADAWGTPPYMAPEQELGTVSRESDLYSLGVLYYEMMTGELPFQGPNFLAQKREKVYKKPSEVVKGLPVQVDEIIAKALEPLAAERYHSGKEFADAVDGISLA